MSTRDRELTDGLDERPRHPMAASIVLVVGVVLLIALLSLGTAL